MANIISPIGSSRMVAAAGGYSSWFATQPAFNPSLRTDGVYHLGCRFSSAAAKSVVALGRYYIAGNVQNHLIGLWSDGGALLASGTILAASASDANGFKWAAIAPYAMAAGTYRIGIDEGGDQWFDESNINAYLNPNFVILGSYYGFGSGSFPANLQTANKCFTSPAIGTA